MGKGFENGHMKMGGREKGKRLLNYILCIRFFSGMHSIVSASQFPYTNLSQGCH